MVKASYNESDLQKYLKELKDNERISITSQEDVLKQFIVPESDDSKGYRSRKIKIVDENKVPLKNSSGIDIVEYVPEEIQLNRRRVLTPDLTTANWTPWKRDTSDEEYCYNLYMLILTCTYIMEKDPRIDLNPFINEIHNEIKWFATVSKSRDGIMLLASRTQRVVNESRELTKPLEGINPLNNPNKPGIMAGLNPNAIDDLTGGPMNKNKNFNGLF